jgi:VIT1/CCC1 family predicted Fe2+/Mn2+ transporter
MQRAGWNRLTIVALGLAAALGVELTSFVGDHATALAVALAITFLALIVLIAIDARNRFS